MFMPIYREVSTADEFILSLHIHQWILIVINNMAPASYLQAFRVF